MGPKKKPFHWNEPRQFKVGEEFRIAINLVIKRFRNNEEEKEHAFPSSFTSNERGYVHTYCSQLGLKTKSRGEGANRFLTVYKKEVSTIVQADTNFELVNSSKQHAIHLLQRFPLTARERQELLPPTERDRMLGHETRDINRSLGRLSSGVPMVPPRRCENEYTPFRQNLPIWNSREEIIQMVSCHQTILVCGETGSGKTTQVPQYILEHYNAIGQPCRIICTEPRRIAAISIAERVASERDEHVGHTVGYQVRLESRISLKTLLTFCTTGVLLRTLMGGDASIATVSHIIVDELHERDKLCDFLLIVLRDLLLKFRNLKIVLMSASLDTQLFAKYFSNCPVIEVPGRVFDVKPFYLEDIIKGTGYVNEAMIKYKKDFEKQKSSKLDSWCAIQASPEGATGTTPHPELNLNVDDLTIKAEPERLDLDPYLIAHMDNEIEEIWLTGSDDFSRLITLMVTENISVDYQHSETLVSPLMLAAGRGNMEAADQLLTLGSSLHLKSTNGWTAMEWASNFGHKDMEELLAGQCNYDYTQDFAKPEEPTEMSEEDKILFDGYMLSCEEDKIDHNLVLCLLERICASQEEGAILIFLPGYEDIITLRDKILTESKGMPENRLSLFTLHSQMQSADQKRVFKPVPRGIRKIVLATNIAETSITINDVVFVVDCGKVKEKTFDALTGASSLKAGWISKASATQRRGRAGRCRPGICYHIYSKARYNSFQKFQVPEILRVPIHELCLQAKLLAPPNAPIADFLAKAPDPPPFMVTRNAVVLLKAIDALDPWEELTELGLHLLDLPIEPRLGKMVLYSVVLKCLDPILTIACCLAYRDPFILPSNPAQRRAMNNIKREFAQDTFSDHMVLLKTFQAWSKAKSDGYERQFCKQNFLSPAVLEMVCGMRSQLLGQLRASGFVRVRGAGDIRDLNQNSEIWPVIKAALCAGTYPNIIRIDRNRKQLITQKESKLKFHHSSVLARLGGPPPNKGLDIAWHKKHIRDLPCDWFIYEEMMRAGSTAHAHTCTMLSPITVALFTGPARLPLDALHEPDQGYIEEEDSGDDSKYDNQRAMFKIDDWISFRIEPELARLVLQLRQKWQALFLRRMHGPARPNTQADEFVIRTISSVLLSEDISLSLNQPTGIGQRPRPMEHFSTQDYDLGLRMPNSPNRKNPNFPPNSPIHRNQKFLSSNPSQHTQNLISGSPNHRKPNFMSNSPIHRNMNFPPNSPSHGNMNYMSGSSGANDRSAHYQNYYNQPDDKSHFNPSSMGASNYNPGFGVSSPTQPPMAQSFNPNQQQQQINQSHGSHYRIAYFIIKANTSRAVEISMAKNIFAFTPITERKLITAIKEGKTVILIFSIQGSGHFQGFAKFTPQMSDLRPQEFCAPNLGACYQIIWLKKAYIPFQSTRHLTNAWNENRKVQTSRDGQELEPTVGESLCQLIVDAQFTESMKSSRRPMGYGRENFQHPIDQNQMNRSQIQWDMQGAGATTPSPWLEPPEQKYWSQSNN